MRLIKIHAIFWRDLIYKLRVGIGMFPKYKGATWWNQKMQIRHQYHSTCILFSFVPSLTVFLHFSNHHSVWKCTSSCCCFLLSCSLSIHSSCETRLLLGALSFLLGSGVVVCSLAYWMEECTSLCFCGHQAQHLGELFTSIKHILRQTILSIPTYTQYTVHKMQCLLDDASLSLPAL